MSASKNSVFKYQNPFEKGKNKTKYRLLSKKYVKTINAGGKKILKIDPAGLEYLSSQAIRDISFLLRDAHQKQVAKILKDPKASANDKFVALSMLQNAEISSQFILPFCQDTGTAIVMAKKGEQVWTNIDDKKHISKGIWKTYQKENLRYSQVVPLTMYKEKNSGDNMPAQIDIYSAQGMEYEFLFMTKGGGSANKTMLYQETKALLNPDKLKIFLVEKMKSLGTAACPPYHIAFVVGGTSAESCLKTVKLLSAGYFDNLPLSGNDGGRAFRDKALEKELLNASYKLGFGAQFGGKYFAHDIKVVRLPRHGASCPVGMGVSCSADRNILGKINKSGIWLEKLDTNPGKLIPSRYKKKKKSCPKSFSFRKFNPSPF